MSSLRADFRLGSSVILALAVTSLMSMMPRAWAADDTITVESLLAEDDRYAMAGRASSAG